MVCCRPAIARACALPEICAQLEPRLDTVLRRHNQAVADANAQDLMLLVSVPSRGRMQCKAGRFL